MTQPSEPPGDFLSQLTKTELLDIIHALKHKHNLSLHDLKHLQQYDMPILLPNFIFNRHLSALESICKYLKENLGFTYHKIAILLARNDRTIWTTYQHAAHKYKKPFPKNTPLLTIPLPLFANRKLSTLEHLVTYLKDALHLPYHMIAKTLERNDRTVWTVYQRAQHKLNRRKKR